MFVFQVLLKSSKTALVNFILISVRLPSMPTKHSHNFEEKENLFVGLIQSYDGTFLITTCVFTIEENKLIIGLLLFSGHIF